MATSAVWALLLLCLALFRGGAWRVAVPLFDGAAPEPALLPAEPDRDAADAQAEQPAPAARWMRWARGGRRGLPGPLSCAVAATALVRVGFLLAAGR